MPKVIEILRNATRSRHANLASGAALSRLFAANYTVSEYQSHLGRMLGLIEPLERAAALAVESIAAENGPAAAQPERSRDLQADLIAMGAPQLEIDGFERCLQIPPLSVAGLRGYTYVILGSMLGGKIIVKQLRAVLGSKGSYSFYGGGQQQNEAQWASFCSDLEETAEQDVETICATAMAVFDVYAAWLSEPPARARDH